jgi:hypothetical protein
LQVHHSLRFALTVCSLHAWYILLLGSGSRGERGGRSGQMMRLREQITGKQQTRQTTQLARRKVYKCVNCFRTLRQSRSAARDSEKDARKMQWWPVRDGGSSHGNLEDAFNGLESLNSPHAIVLLCPWRSPFNGNAPTLWQFRFSWWEHPAAEVALAPPHQCPPTLILEPRSIKVTPISGAPGYRKTRVRRKSKPRGICKPICGERHSMKRVRCLWASKCC